MNPKLKTGLTYLASPYSKYPYGIRAAFEIISSIAGDLIRLGVNVYSPIAHSHPIARFGEIDPYDYQVWLPQCDVIIDKCDAMLIAKMKGWDRSFGIKHERERFNLMKKPIFFLDPTTMEFT